MSSLQEKLLTLVLDFSNHEKIRKKVSVMLLSIPHETSLKNFYEILNTTEPLDINLYKSVIEDLVESSNYNIKLGGFLLILTHKL